MPEHQPEQEIVPDAMAAMRITLFLSAVEPYHSATVIILVSFTQSYPSILYIRALYNGKPSGTKPKDSDCNVSFFINDLADRVLC